MPKAVELDDVEWLNWQFFSEEKIFAVDAAFNKRNDCWIAFSSSEVQKRGTSSLISSATMKNSLPLSIAKF